jgi:hypothetical protein
MTLSAKVDPALETKLAKAQAARANELAAIHEVTIESAEDYTFADTLLTECARNRDALVEQRKTVTTPLYTVIRTVEGWFKPSVSELEGAIDHLKKVMGGWRIEQARAEQEARRAALAAAKAQDTPALHAALERVHEAAPAQAAPGRAKVRWAWQAEVVDPAAVPREFLCVDVAALGHLAKAAGSGDVPPESVPGVTWNRVPIMGAKR